MHFAGGFDVLGGDLDVLGGGALGAQCPVCFKTFTTRSNARIHLRAAHSDARPFGCGLCERTFRYKTQLVRHRRHHAPDTQFPCPRCHTRFNDKSSYNRHVRRTCSALV